MINRRSFFIQVAKSVVYPRLDIIYQVNRWNGVIDWVDLTWNQNCVRNFLQEAFLFHCPNTPDDRHLPFEAEVECLSYEFLAKNYCCEYLGFTLIENYITNNYPEVFIVRWRCRLGTNKKWRV